jgi:hypothetical protein
MFAGFAMMRGAELAAVEKDAFGTDHPTAGALWLDSLDLPHAIVDVVRTQLAPADPSTPLALALRSGRLLASAVARKDDADAALATLGGELRSRLTAEDGRPDAGFTRFYDALGEIKAKG